MTPVVCLITDRARVPGGADGTVACVTWAARAGVQLVQVRERDLDGGPLTALVRRCVAAVRGTRTRVLVNDRLDVALAAGAVFAAGGFGFGMNVGCSDLKMRSLAR